MVPNSQPVICLVGPTAVGKTAAAIALVEHFAGRAEIISADSVQVYRCLDIGSAKPTEVERRSTQFHLVDILDPSHEFTLSDFQAATRVAVAEIRARGHLPIVVGGAGLYIRALTRPLGLPHVPPDLLFRDSWAMHAEQHGRESVHAVLADRDPVTARRLHPNDLKRVIRALEVLEHTGRTLSEWHRGDQESGSAILSDVRLFGLTRDRASLNRIIDQRVDSMMADGFLDEVKQLRAAGYPRTLNSMQTLGYNELNAYLDNETDLPAAVDAIKLHTRQFARRQLIWFRADSRIRWIDVDDIGASDVAAEVYYHFNS